MIVTWTVGAVSPSHRYLDGRGLVETWLSALLVVVSTTDVLLLSGSYTTTLAMRGSYVPTVSVYGQM